MKNACSSNRSTRGTSRPSRSAGPAEAYAWALMTDKCAGPGRVRRPTRRPAERDGRRPRSGSPRQTRSSGDLGRLLARASTPAITGRPGAYSVRSPASRPTGLGRPARAAGRRPTAWMRTHSFEHTGAGPAEVLHPGFNTGYRGGDPDAWGYPAGAYCRLGREHRVHLRADDRLEGRLQGRPGRPRRVPAAGRVHRHDEPRDRGQLAEHGPPPPAPGPRPRAGPRVQRDRHRQLVLRGPRRDPRRDRRGHLSTHRSGSPRGRAGGFLSGLVYRDGNGNGRYDAGEGHRRDSPRRPARRRTPTRWRAARSHGVSSEGSRTGSAAVSRGRRTTGLPSEPGR